jgi:predicted small lipoprotein YifL
MTPTACASARRLLAGGLLVVVLALALTACGSKGPAAATGEGPGSTAQTKTSAPRAQGEPAESAAPSASCRTQLNGFLAAMVGLRSKLEVGLSYDEYVAEVARVRAAYDSLPTGQLALSCLIGAGTPAEKAFNRYIAAANTWGECLSESGCRATSIEAQLQDEWEVASHFLAAARRAS